SPEVTLEIGKTLASLKSSGERIPDRHSEIPRFGGVIRPTRICRRGGARARTFQGLTAGLMVLQHPEAVQMDLENEELDLWAPVSRAALPKLLRDGIEHRDWPTVRSELRKVMDGLTTDGSYGRALLQVVLDLPIGIDPLFDSYRAAASIDHG